MSPRFIESAASFFGIAAVAATAVAATLGCLAWYFSYQASELKRTALESFQRESTLAISSAEARGSEANEKAANANERAAKLEKEAAQARLDLEQMKERQRFREITNEQKAIFIRETASAPKGKLSVYVLQQDAEIARYANQIRAMIVEAGFDSGIMVGVGFGSGADPVGVILLVKDPKAAPPFAEISRRALIAAGIGAVGMIDPALPPDEVKIIVGRKEIK